MSKKSLILDLYEAMNDADPKAALDSKKYFESTQTLYAEAKENNNYNNDPSQSEYTIIPVESEIYQHIIANERKFIVTNQKGLIIGNEFKIIETKDLLPTGKYLIKRITGIITSIDEPGLKDGYYIILC